MSFLPPNDSVHGIPEYLNYRVVLDHTSLQAFIPFIYIIPTTFVMIRILMLYFKAKKARNSGVMDFKIFSMIMLYFLFNSLFFIGDYLHLNLPSSGILTSWCASIKPNRYLSILIVFAYATNLAVLICPFLVCLFRLIILMAPRDHELYCKNAMSYFAMPFLFLTPIALTFINWSATCYCKQMNYPFSFGSLEIYEGDFLASLNIYIHFTFSVVIISSNVIISFVMICKLRKIVYDTSSARGKNSKRRAEWSLHLTLISSVVPFITSSIVSLTFIFHRANYFYVLFLRPIGNDIETVMMPWVLYLTHPMFRTPLQPKISTSGSTVMAANRKIVMSFPNGSVHGIQAYKDYVVVLNYTTLQAFIPFIYIIPTIFIMLRILYLYWKAKRNQSSAMMDHNIFALIMFYFMFNSLFYVGDYLHLNLPSSGLLTNWCASIEPSRYFAILIIYAYAANFGVIICPFLVCLFRLIILLSPRDNERYCRLVMRYFAIPFLFVTPLVLTGINYSVTGYCKQMDHPFSFGSLIIFEGDFLAELNIYIHLSFSFLIYSLNVIMTLTMLIKLRKTVFDTTSSRTRAMKRKAEWSLHLTILSSAVPFITNSICSLTFIFNRANYFYVLFLRPIGNDYETVMMPWVLYLTHPMFRKKKSTDGTNTASNVFVTTTTSRSSQLR